MKNYYHYTNIDSFYNIFINKNLWFSSLSYMNDEFEGLEFNRVLSEELDDNHQILKNTINQLKDIYRHDKYLFSGTLLRDDISQWRAYTTLGSGICFGFTDGFILDKTIKKVSCIYDLEKKKDFIYNNTELKHYTNEEFSLEKRRSGSVSKLVEHFSLGMECFKHESFASEKEIRWIDDLNSKVNLDVHYRPHRLGLLPYRSISIDISKISEIILGPQVPNENITTFHKLFRDFNNIKIISSEVTLK